MSTGPGVVELPPNVNPLVVEGAVAVALALALSVFVPKGALGAAEKPSNLNPVAGVVVPPLPSRAPPIAAAVVAAAVLEFRCVANENPELAAVLVVTDDDDNNFDPPLGVAAANDGGNAAATGPPNTNPPVVILPDVGFAAAITLPTADVDVDSVVAAPTADGLGASHDAQT